MSVDHHLKLRQQLIAEDRAKRLDQDNFQQFSELHARADAIVRRIRAEEAVSVWGPDNHAFHGEDDATHLFPGMAFLTARELIVETRLFKIMTKMPKGALLHAHLDATVNARVLLNLALKHPIIHVRAPGNLSPEKLAHLVPEFLPAPSENLSSFSSLTDPSYEADSWVPLQKARENFAPELGGPRGFDKWINGALTISPAEAYRTHNTTSKIWDKFSKTFVTADHLISFMPIWREYIREFFLSSVEDGISYVEARINFWYKTMFGEDGQRNIPHREWLVVFDQVLKEVKAELKAQGREGEFVDCRIIYTTLRFISNDELRWYMEDCIALKKEFPHLIVGFDLVGHEDSLVPLIDYIEPLTEFPGMQKKAGVHIPYIFHAGETLGDGNAPDSNLYDAILLGTKRIGHGFSMIKHPKLMEICRERKIALEVCPISNEILRLTSSMPMHPLPALMAHGVPVALCSDDPAVFGNMGLSYDYFQVLVASEINGLHTMGCLARDSLKYSTMSDEEKERAIALWQKRWDEFIEWVVREEGLSLAAPAKHAD